MSYARLFRYAGGLVMSVLFVAGCAVSASLHTTWIASDYEQIRLSKIAVFVISKDPERIRIAENILASKIGPEAVPGTPLLQPGDEGNHPRVAERLRQAGFDGALTLRVIGVENIDVEILRAPPPSYGGPLPFAPTFGGHYYASMDAVMARETYYYKHYVVETVAYSLKREAAIWRGVAEANDPDSVAEAAEDVGAVLGRVLHKAGFI